MKKFSENFIDFIDAKGFYIALIICIVGIGVTILAVAKQTNDQLTIDPQDELALSADIPTDLSTVLTNDDTSMNFNIQGTEIDNNDTTNFEKDTSLVESIEVSPPQETEEFKLTSPVYGKIFVPYSMNALMYSKTLQEWTVHSGIDISGKIGTSVRAAADGIVNSVETDPMLGYSILIDHENGISTRYSNLSTKTLVKPGQAVARGATIGAIGDTATSEILEEPHLHFEVIKDGTVVDPTEYLPNM